MSYETGTATNIADLFTKLETFAVANGWTSDYSTTDRLFLTRSTVSVAFRWASASPTGFGVYQHLAFVGSGTAPGSHTSDSGQGAVSGTDATIIAGRSVVCPNSSMAYWFFESDTYIHCVVETAASRYAHFGFGILTKKGTYTGGEYSYGNRVGGDTAFDPLATFLLDGHAGLTSPASVIAFVGVVHIESLPNQTASGKWGVTWAGGLANTGTDRATVARENLQGGFRGGPNARGFGRYGGATTSGLVPLVPLGIWYDDRSNARWYPLGYMPDVRSVNMKNFVGAQEITIGSDVWLVFPAKYKSSVATQNTRNLGMAYKKVTT